MIQKLLFSLILLPFFMLYARTGNAQCAVYYCPEMGAVGYSYSDDETGNDFKAIKQQARASCEQMGGKSCTLLYATPQVGWGGFVKGKDIKGNLICVAVGHQLNERFARSELKRKYLMADGVEFDDVLMITWMGD